MGNLRHKREIKQFCSSSKHWNDLDQAAKALGSTKILYVDSILVMFADYLKVNPCQPFYTPTGNPKTNPLAISKKVMTLVNHACETYGVSHIIFIYTAIIKHLERRKDIASSYAISGPKV